MRKAETILGIIRERGRRKLPLKDHWKADLRSKDSRAVWRGAVGKVPVKVTRWQPTLRHARFCSRGEESDFLIDCNRLAALLRFGRI